MTRRKDKRTETSKKPGQQQLTRFQKSLLDEADRLLTVRIDGKTEEITMEQAAIRRGFQTAVNGSPHAMGHIFRGVGEAQRLNQALIREDIAEGRRIKAHFEQRLSKAVRDGADPVWVVPHPDDVVITDEGWI
ncbi:MAG: hypothetical protein K8H74_18145, partial [Notoacmeibacter sp.]|nr:hypothetical protein [Notoacmeibacter sp.]